VQKLNSAQPLRPTQYVEKFLVTAILDGTYPPGSTLPNERSLARQLGITRPTLRETLQRLSSQGWVRIHHGKPTMVNDYWQDGGLSLLGTLAKYGGNLPNGFITHLLEVRVAMLPSVAGRAATYHPDTILDYLSHARDLDKDVKQFSNYDWDLQMLMARNSHNPVFALILNDFASNFTAMSRRYFSSEKARRASLAYYQELSDTIKNGNQSRVEGVVKMAMQQSLSIWEELTST
jgi:GntR family negative regulator for fad regulon and positive regulator of fabA